MPFRGLNRQNDNEQSYGNPSRRDTPSPSILPSPEPSLTIVLEPEKVPTKFTFVPCLSFCCFIYDHRKGVVVYAALSLAILLGLLSFNVFAIVNPITDLLAFVSLEYEYINLGMIILSLGANATLLWAVLLRTKFAMLPWLVVTLIQIMFYLGLDLYHIIVLFSDWTNSSLLKFGILSAICAHLIYFWCVVWSLYMRLGDPTDRINKLPQDKSNTETA